MTFQLGDQGNVCIVREYGQVHIIKKQPVEEVYVIPSVENKHKQLLKNKRVDVRFKDTAAQGRVLEFISPEPYENHMMLIRINLSD